MKTMYNYDNQHNRITLLNNLSAHSEFGTAACRYLVVKYGDRILKESWYLEIKRRDYVWHDEDIVFLEKKFLFNHKRIFKFIDSSNGMRDALAAHCITNRKGAYYQYCKMLNYKIKMKRERFITSLTNLYEHGFSI